MGTEVFLLKLIVSVVTVIFLSMIAERVSPRMAGLISGYPTGQAITLFFFGFENGAVFAAESAIYSMIGLVAMQTFIYFYYRGSLKINIIGASVAAIVAYFIVAWALHFINLPRFVALLIPIASIPLFIYLLKPVQNIKIKKQIQLKFPIVVVRAVIAASIILVVTGVAKLIGPKWAGLFAAFPTTLYPLLLIVHWTYSKKHAHTIIKNVPEGIFSLILYTFSISIVYPVMGIYFGTAVAFAVATAYLLIYIGLKKQPAES